MFEADVGTRGPPGVWNAAFTGRVKTLPPLSSAVVVCVQMGEREPGKGHKAGVYFSYLD